eukprot:5079-Heterococcus_DN1.PRE.1
MLRTTTVHYQVDWSAVRAQLGTMASLGLFLLLLVPIRIPTLSLTTGEEADFNKEIKAHGIANLASGLCGSVHNYLSLDDMLHLSAAAAAHGTATHHHNALTCTTTTLNALLPTTATLTACSTTIWEARAIQHRPSLINYVPRCVAGCVMATLGVDLIRDALWRARLQLDRFEYSSVAIITAVIAVRGFVSGLEAGVFLATLTFVLQSSRTSAVRTTFSGDGVRSNT